MPLIGDGRAVVVAECGVHAERYLAQKAQRTRIAVLERRHGVRQRALPAMAHALGEHRLQAVVVRPAVHQVQPDDAPVGERTVDETAAHLGVVVQRNAASGVVRDVDVVLDAMLAPAAGEHVVRFERHVVPKLPLEAHRRLPAMRHVRQLAAWRRRELDQIAEEAAGRGVVRIAKQLRGRIE